MTLQTPPMGPGSGQTQDYSVAIMTLLALITA